MLPLITFLLLMGLHFSPEQAEQTGDHVSVKVQPLKRSDLPNDFPFQVLDEGFAILKVEISNEGSQYWSWPEEAVSVKDPRGKNLNIATPEDMTPKIMKYYRGGGAPPVRGEARYGTPTYYPGTYRRGPTVGVGAGSGGRTVSIDTPKRLRATFHEYQIGTEPLAPGEERSGFLYLKSDRSGNQLSGGKLQFGDRTIVLE